MLGERDPPGLTPWATGTDRARLPECRRHCRQRAACPDPPTEQQLLDFGVVNHDLGLQLCHCFELVLVPVVDGLSIDDVGLLVEH